MTGEPGQRRSVFKVVVHLGEHATREDALAAWPGEMNRLRQTGRESKADKLQGKLDRLRSLRDSLSDSLCQSISVNRAGGMRLLKRFAFTLTCTDMH